MNTTKPSIVIHGISTVDELPGIEPILSDFSVRCAPNLKALRDALPGASVLLEWKFDAIELNDAWDCADQLRWIQWPGAGVDAALSPFLVESDIVLTNMHGVFDRPIAEYVLGLILAFAKDLPETYHAQKERRWAYRWTERVEGCQVLVVTHSPQVAARGTHHWRVSKSEQAMGQAKAEDMTRVWTSVEVLDDPRRKEEIARMLAGAKVTDEARAAADSLLAGAAE